MMDEMIANAEEFYQSLGIPYRIVNIVSGKEGDREWNIKFVGVEGLCVCVCGGGWGWGVLIRQLQYSRKDGILDLHVFSFVPSSATA